MDGLSTGEGGGAPLRTVGVHARGPGSAFC
jgi:hypothetical protein